MSVVKSVLASLFDSIGRLRSRRSRWDIERLRAYGAFLAAMDCAHAATGEYLNIRRRLHWWNGASRLRVMRATGLDKRIIQAGEEACTTVELVRMIGSAAVVREAEALLDMVATPLLRLEAGEKDFEWGVQAFDERRRALQEVVRNELRVDEVPVATRVEEPAALSVAL